MKNLCLFLCFIASAAYCQTNTFPTSGNAGIGVTTPNANLHIRSVGASPWLALDKNPSEETGIQFRKSGNVLFYFYSDNDHNDALKIQATNLTGENDATPRIHIPSINKDLYLVQSGGNVAIGHNTPYSHTRMHVKSPSASPWGILAEAYGNGKVIGVGHDGTEGYVSVSYLDGSGYTPLNLRTSNLTRLSVAVDGKVGIGPGQPSAKFNIQQASGNWNDGIRLSLASKNWDIVSDTNGDRLIIAKDQSVTNGMVIYNGNVGIGTSQPNQKLTVNGTIYGKEVKVDLNVPGPDYVFEKDYNLPSLEEIETYIDEHKHLPEVPSAMEMEKNGIDLSKMNILLLKKIEEMTLHMIEMKKQIDNQEKLIEKLIKG